MLRLAMLHGVFRLLPERLQEALARLGYREPTPVQEKAIPVILTGSHTVVVAPTGSGKTEAALLPLFARIMGSRGDGVKVIYVTPLRSLNRDIFERMSRLAELIGLRMMVRHGDSAQAEKKLFLENPPDVMVTTPETLYFLLSVKRFRESLRDLKAVVVDELHEMVDDKRGTELALALERVELYAGHRVQRVGLSATLRDPHLAARMLVGERPVIVVDARDVVKRIRVYVDSPKPGPEDQSLAGKLGVERESTAARMRKIAELLSKTPGSSLVFTNTRDTAEVLGALLRRLLGEDAVLVHHGSLSRSERVRAEKLLREGRVKAVVATSSLELGIDIGYVDLVIQYMSPRQALRLIQRVGRSRHRLGEESRGVIIASDNVFDILESAVIAARTMRGDLEPQEPYQAPLDALAHQLAGWVLEAGEKGVDIEEAYWIITRTLPYQGMEFKEFEELIDYLDWAGILRRRGSRIYVGRRTASYYFSTTMIPDTKQYPVIDVASRKRIGVLDEEFAASLEEDELFVLGGRVWQVVSVEGDRVLVRQAEASELIPPAWEGDLIPVDWRVAREVGSILRRMSRGQQVLNNYPLTVDAAERVREVVGKHVGEGLPLPSDRRVVVEGLGETVIVFAFLGSRGSKALELALTSFFKQVRGYAPRSASTPYAVVLSFASETPSSLVIEAIKALAGMPWSEVEELILSAARRTRLFEWKLTHVARRMGAVDPEAKIEKRLLSRLADSLVGREALKEMLHDKIDLEPLKRLLEDIAAGRVEVVGYDRRRPSPLAEQVLGEARVVDKVAEQLPSTILAEVMKRRLANRRLKLICVRCGYVWEARLADLEEKPRCPRCNVSFIAPLKHDEKIAVEAVRKAWRRQKMSQQEKKVFNELQQAANLVLTYGRRALEAMAVTGVGPTTAKKVLQKLVFGEEAYYKALAEAEQRYLRTRKYWD